MKERKKLIDTLAFGTRHVRVDPFYRESLRFDNQLLDDRVSAFNKRKSSDNVIIINEQHSKYTQKRKKKITFHLAGSPDHKPRGTGHR